jgi:VanZ family protein
MRTANNPDMQKVSPFEFTTRLLAPVAWATIIIYLSLIPSPPQLPGILGWDKLLHAGAYGLLAVLIAQFIICLSHNPVKSCWYAGLAAIFYGGLLELLQLLIQTGRTAEWWDLFADIVGVFFACVLFRQVSSIMSQPDETPGANNG